MKDRGVFISHSDRDRQSATEPRAVLRRYGAQTFLDQDQIQAGQVLPQRIMLTQACLGETSSCWFWSNSATSSSWVEREWNLAYQLKRRIVPYVIDKSPPESVNLIWPRSMLLFGPPVRFTGSVLSGQIRVRTVAVRSRAGCQVELQTPIG